MLLQQGAAKELMNLNRESEIISIQTGTCNGKAKKTGFT